MSCRLGNIIIHQYSRPLLLGMLIFLLMRKTKAMQGLLPLT
jgi:hypothetical protein